jgi:S1-C subfamily serine protease
MPMSRTLIVVGVCTLLASALALQQKTTPTVASPASPTQQPVTVDQPVQPVRSTGGTGTTITPPSDADRSGADRTVRFLERRSRAITVKILAGNAWGSGILIHRQGRTYTVLTNEHVMLAGERFQIQTPDDRIYPVIQSQQSDFHGNDIALMKFTSPARYEIAALGNSSGLRVGNQVFASGFASQDDSSRAAHFRFTRGQVTLIMNKAFDGGYRVGYTNNVVIGMSGGPLLDSRGQVVALNGMRAYPLWGDPYVFQDGSRPPRTLQNLLVKSSWAIPVETVVSLAPKSLRLSYFTASTPGLR